MLQTPLGALEIKIDNHIIEYEVWEVPLDRTCNDLNGRYAIVVYNHYVWIWCKMLILFKNIDNQRLAQYTDNRELLSKSYNERNLHIVWWCFMQFLLLQVEGSFLVNYD